MPQERETIHRLVRKRRIEAGITQSELARHAGCKQSAISMFESGRLDAISRDKLASIAERLGIPSDALPAEEHRTAPGPKPTRRLYFCPTDECPSNLPYIVRGNLNFRPAFHRYRQETKGKPVCPWCGELLESVCPECGAAVVRPSSFCPQCGTPYVTATVTDSMSPDQVRRWVEARRREIRELFSHGEPEWD